MSHQQTVTLPDGRVVRLGNNPPAAGLTKAWPVYGDTPDAPMVPKSDWDKYVTEGLDDPFLPPVHDQDGVGQCNCDATSCLAESVRMMQGLDFVALSAADLYDRINGGADNGSMLEDAMHEMLTGGIGTVKTVGTDIWHRGMKTAPASERVLYKALKVFLCPTFEHCFSATVSGFRIVSGVMWYNNYNPGSDGWLPTQGRGGGGGHAVFGYKPMKKGSLYGIAHQNSWRSSWGVNGRCVFPQTMYEGGGIGGWWAIRSMTDEGGVVPAPKG